MSSYYNDYCVEREKVKHITNNLNRLEKELQEKEKYDKMSHDYLEYQKMMSDRMFKLLSYSEDNVRLIVESEEK